MKKIGIVVILLASHIAFFVGGAFTGKTTTTSWLVEQTRLADAEVMLGHYATYRDIAVDVAAGKVDRALCNADLGASAMFDSVKDCVGEERCKARLQQMIARSAPELLGTAPIPFKYSATKDGRKICNHVP